MIQGVSENLPEETDTRCIAVVAALKAARHALGWSQSQLAQYSGISRVTLARMEAGMLMPRAATLDTLLQALERVGVIVSVGTPADGFTMAVEGAALRAPAKSPLASIVEEVLDELGVTVSLRDVGRLQGDKRGILKRGKDAATSNEPLV